MKAKTTVNNNSMMGTGVATAGDYPFRKEDRYPTAIGTSIGYAIGHPLLDLIDNMEKLFEASPFNNSFLSIIDNFSRLRHYTDVNGPDSKYPPLNIFMEDDTYIVEMAVAGFSKENLSVSLAGEKLEVSGKANEEPYNDKNSGSIEIKREMLYRGLARRNFTRTLVLPENAKVNSVELKDGILTIKIYKEPVAKVVPIEILEIK